MPSTFSSNVSLEKQQTGENSNSWGILLNQVLDQIDRLVGGHVSVDVGGALDVSLAAAQSERHSLTFTGLLTGNVNVIFPANGQTWTVRNATSGSFVLTCKTAAGTGVIIAQGDIQLIQGDNTNIVSDRFTTQDGRQNFAVTGGSANAYTLTVYPVVAAYVIGQKFRAKANHTIAGTVAPSISVSGLAALPLTSRAVALGPDDIQTGDIFEFTYDGTNAEVAAARGFRAGQTFTSTDAGATEVVSIDLFRDSASPAANDLLQSITWSARSSIAVKRVAAKALAKLLDPTDTTEDAELHLSTLVAGALADVLILGQGAQIGAAPTGGDKGAGTLNVATNYYRAGSVMLGPDALVGATTASPDVTANGVLYIPTGAGFALTLPAISTVFNGYRVGIHNQCSSSAPVATRSSSDTIVSGVTGALTSVTLPSVGDMVWFIADKTNSRWLLQGTRSSVLADTALTTIASASNALAHSLGVPPTSTKAQLVCTTNNLNYVAATPDIVDLPIGTLDTNGVASGFITMLDGTNVTVIATAMAVFIPNKTTFASAAITPGSWDLRLTCYAIN